MTDEQRIADLTAIKELGANFVRLGHYSHDPVIYDTADKLGIILYDEVPWNRGGVGGAEWRKNTQEMTRSMIAQNYNRASVFLWSLGNEMYWLPDQEGGGDKARVAEELQLLHDIAKEMDPGRLTTIRKFPEGADIIDVYSPSIWAGWYGGGYVQYHDAIKAARAEHPYLLHMEYGTPIRPENPLPFVNMKGLTQRDGVKKDVYHVFASYWKKDPVCWIESPSWNYRTGNKGEAKTISVFCNTDSAELSLNGKALGKKTRDITKYPASGLTWDVEFEEGENTLSVDGFDT